MNQATTQRASRHPRDKAAFFVAAVLALGVSLNVIEFRSIEAEIDRNWRAWHTYETSDLDRYRHAEQRYGFFLSLGRLAPGARLIVPAPRPPTPTRLPSFQPRIYGISRIAELDSRDYDPIELGERFDTTGHVVAQGPYGSDNYYQIALLDDGPSELVFLMTESEDLIVVDLRLLDDSLRREVGP